MRVVVLIIFFVGFVFANNNIDVKSEIKEEFKELRKDMRENNRLLLEVMKANQESTNRRFEDMNSKFNMILTVMLSGFILILGYLIKERNSIKKDIKVSKNRKDFEAILHKYHIV